MEPFKVLALVLRHRDLGEADRVLTLLTRERGKLSAVVRGCRKPGARNAGITEPFTHMRVMLAPGRSLYTLTQWEFLDGYWGLRQTLEMLMRATYVCDLVGELTVEHEPCPDVFDLTLQTLDLLQAPAAPGDSDRADRVLSAFELQLLKDRGYGLSLDQCAHCGRHMQRSTTDNCWSFSAAAGGVLCQKCRYRLRDSFPVSGEAVDALRRLADLPITEAGDLSLASDDERKIRQCLEWSIRYRCEKALDSLGMLHAVLDMRHHRRAAASARAGD